MNIELMYYLFLGVRGICNGIHRPTYLTSQKCTHHVNKKSKINFTLVYMPTSKNKYDRVTGIYAITNIRDTYKGLSIL